jgi:hypothetical protein
MFGSSAERQLTLESVNAMKRSRGHPQEEPARLSEENDLLFLLFLWYTLIRITSQGGDAMEELREIQEQIVKLCAPEKILLFGSRAKGTATARSDIDLCVIASTTNKRALLTDLYCDTQSDTPIDFLLYTPEEWDQCVSDYQSFAHKLNQEGIVLYG